MAAKPEWTTTFSRRIPQRRSVILGRNMFGPVRSPWPGDSWRGWWGDGPPYHTPVFVLTHHARAPIPMKGGIIFYFVTDGIGRALEHAQAAENDKDICLGGGFQRSGNTSPPGWWTRCIWRIHQSCSGPAKACSRESTSLRSAIRSVRSPLRDNAFTLKLQGADRTGAENQNEKRGALSRLSRPCCAVTSMVWLFD